MEKVVVKLDNISKKFNDKFVIKNLSLDIYEGEFITLLGSSGCGKTTILRMISGLDHVTEGKVFIDNIDVTDIDPTKREFRFNIYNGVCVSAMNLNARAIVAYTESGSTPRIVSSYSPKCPIYAITDDEKLWRQLNLQWNVYPMLVKKENNIDKMITEAIDKLISDEKLKKDDIVIIAGGAEILPDIESSINKVIGGIIKI